MTSQINKRPAIPQALILVAVTATPIIADMCPVEPERHTTEVPALSELAITIVHDNNPCVDSLKTAWGFSAFVTGAEKTILFDTGSDGTLLLANMAKLQLDPGRIDLVVLSHIHGDHTGGLTGLLQENPRVQVVLPGSSPAKFKAAVQGHGTTLVEIKEPQEICQNVYTTGVLGRRIKEQALVLRTQRGLVVLTGCAHPGVARIVQEVGHLYEGSVLLVIGGFHLEWVTKGRVQRIISAFQSYGIRYVAPTHCSGDKARQLFRQSYGPGYVEAGAGKTITLTELAI
jgi:7,8-dihydropterin-6-yl-methyl-4-(beta-D-ribofuranosyl)aminobenzene 5'-phosphate synthase